MRAKDLLTRDTPGGAGLPQEKHGWVNITQLGEKGSFGTRGDCKRRFSRFVQDKHCLLPVEVLEMVVICHSGFSIAWRQKFDWVGYCRNYNESVL